MFRFHIEVAGPYSFAHSIRDHGWIALAPCRWLEETQTFQRVERLPDGQVILVQVQDASSESGVSLAVTLAGAPRPIERRQSEIAEMIRWMLRLDEDLQPFYDLAAQDRELWQAIRVGRGRLLRSPSLFEDVIKTICTTNTTWQQTVGMVNRLVMHLGHPYPLDPDLHAFPTPAQIAAAEPEFLRQEVRLGYRGAYVQQLAREVANGQRDLEGLRKSTLSRTELKKVLLDIKGVGEYAANTLLMLLGHYSELAMDSGLRAFTKVKYLDGRTPSEAEMLAIYEPWGEWKYLAYWFDSLD